jgi:hypothetical protein
MVSDAPVVESNLLFGLKTKILLGRTLGFSLAGGGPNSVG